MRWDPMRFSLLPIATIAVSTMAVPGIASDREHIPNKSWIKAQRASAIAMIDKLDMTSFPNSIGPRREPGRRTLAQYGFTEHSTFDDGWAYAKMADGSWEFGIFVLGDSHRNKRLCITDTAIDGGTYHTATAIDVTRGPGDFWKSARALSNIPGCS